MDTKTLENYLERIDQQNAAIEDRFAHVLEINHDLTRQLVSFQANKTQPQHRWFKYKEGFSAQLIQYIFERTDMLAESGHVIDPFAGSGTTLFQASKNGAHSTGIELLPNSAEIIRVRQSISRLDPPDLAKRLREFSDAQSWEQSGDKRSYQHLRITDGAFPKDTEAKLERFLYDAENHPDEDFGRILRFATLCVLESISYTRKDGQYLRWDHRSGRTRAKFEKKEILGFNEAITAKLHEMADDIEHKPYDLGPLFHQEKQQQDAADITLLEGSCLDVLPTLSDNTFTGLVTSPPYCNRYDYTRTYALELALLGIDEQGIKDLRQAMLSCTVENRMKEDLDQKSPLFNKALDAWASQEILQLILEYLYKSIEAGQINNAGIPRMVENYFREMAVTIFESARVLAPGAPFVMVNDNVRYQGAHVPVDLILSDIAQKAGFDVEKVWVLPRGKGNSSQQMGRHGRQEIRKSVYVWRKR